MAPLEFNLDQLWHRRDHRATFMHPHDGHHHHHKKKATTPLPPSSPQTSTTSTSTHDASSSSSPLPPAKADAMREEASATTPPALMEIDSVDGSTATAPSSPFGLHHDDSCGDDNNNLPSIHPKPTTCLPLPSFTIHNRRFFAHYPHIKLPATRVQDYISRHGGRAFAYVHLHNANYHFELPGVGLISYVWVTSYLGKAAMVVTDPLAAPEDMKALLQAFHQQVPGMKHYTAISQSVADALHELGYSTTVFGKDYYADLQKGWKLTKKSSLRRYQKQGKNEGLVVKEQKWEEVDAARVRAISDAWLRTKKWGGLVGNNKAPELQLMTWPFYEGDEWACRKFYCYNKEGTMLAYVFFLPCFREGKVVGYCANILRRDPTMKPSYVLDYLLMTCAEQFRQEGVEYLTLAMAVLHGLYDTKHQSAFTRAIFKLVLCCPDWMLFYPFRKLGAHKDHFKVNRPEPVFTAAKGLRGQASMIQLSVTVTNILPVAKLIHGIHS